MSPLRQLFWLSAIYNFRFTAMHIPGKLNVLTDAVSRLHQPAQCLSFYQHLLSLQPPPQVDASPLANHTSHISADFLCCRFSGSNPGQAAGRDIPLPIAHLFSQYQGDISDSSQQLSPLLSTYGVPSCSSSSWTHLPICCLLSQNPQVLLITKLSEYH